LLVAGFQNAVGMDYAAYAGRQGEGRVAVVTDAEEGRRIIVHAPVAAVVLFLGHRLNESDRRAVDALVALAGERQARFIGVVSTFRVHFGDDGAAAAEAHVLARTKGLGARTVVFRPGTVLSRHSRASANLRRLGFSYPLVPGWLRGCCLDGEELFAAVESERHALHSRGPRTYTLLGPNRPWRELLAQHGARGPWRACLTAVSALLALLLVGQLAGLLLALLIRRRPMLRCWNFDMLRPNSFRELLGLYNRYNYQHVKVVGYNNGVIHFGHRYPGKTIISTASCNRVASTGAGLLKADCGTTVRKALDFLAGAGQELPVVPNYSYVCLGTSYFVPIHGSAADYSTVADTITRVVLYDPVRDRLIAATRNEPAFREHVYNLQTDVLLLRLWLRAKPKSRYYVQRQALQRPASQELVNALRDDRATNVEIRKARASSDTVTVSRYYKDSPPVGQDSNPVGVRSTGLASCPTGAVLELPRDTLGRLWDRLEENPATSFVMHALTRYFAWHVELFFTAEEFATFWEGHRALPLRKLQLRYIRRDGLPHSPFREHDCISVDLFMLRRHRRRFEAYLKSNFAVVRTNPGKHSR
jgi:hypothetical protein